MARRGGFSAMFNGVRYLLFALGVLILIGTEAEASSDVRAFAWMCVVIGFPVPLLVLPFRFVVWLLDLFGIGKRKPQAAPVPQMKVTVEWGDDPATVAHMMPNTADMVRVHRYTGMRPCELCALKWSLIDTSRLPWVYRVPPDANKNEWRGELGQPRVVCIGPKARAILERHKDGGDVPFSPVRAMAEYIAARHAARVTPMYGKRKNAPHVPRVLGERWTTDAYTKTIRAACGKAGIAPWGSNRLRHTFGTEVRRAFGLEAARAVLGHTGGGCVTDVYTFDALADEMVRKAAPAVEALG